MSAPTITRDILYFGREMTIGCDANCGKAWGICARPRVNFDPAEPDDYAFLPDCELGEAPADPGTYEGGHGKPQEPSERLNKWCIRQCERSEMVDRGQPLVLKDWSVRLLNMPSRHKDPAPTASPVPGRTG